MMCWRRRYTIAAAGLAVDIVKAAADKRKTLGGEIDNRRRHVELAVEPRLDGMLFAGFDVGQMAGLQRAQMRRYRLDADDLLVGRCGTPSA